MTQTLKHGILKHIAPIHSKESLSALHWVSEWTVYVVHYCQQPLMRWMHWLKKNDGSEVTVQHTHTHTNDTGTALRGPRSGVCVVQTPVSGDIAALLICYWWKRQRKRDPASILYFNVLSLFTCQQHTCTQSNALPSHCRHAHCVTMNVPVSSPS